MYITIVYSGTHTYVHTRGSNVEDHKMDTGVETERAIRGNYTKQLHYLQVNPILGMLYEKEVIGRVLKEQINTERDPLRKRTLLLDHISLQPLEVLDTYCAILEHSAKTDCIYVHRQIAQEIRSTLSKGRTAEVERDSVVLPVTEKYTEAQQGMEEVFPAEEKRLLQFTNDKNKDLACISEVREIKHRTANSENNAVETSALLPVHSTSFSKDAGLPFSKISPKKNESTESSRPQHAGVVTCSTSEHLEFVGHMYGCFDYNPNKTSEGAVVCTKLASTGSCYHEEFSGSTEKELPGNRDKEEGLGEEPTGCSTKYQQVLNGNVNSQYHLCPVVQRLKPSGPLKSQTHRKLVQMLWNLRLSEPAKAKLALDVVLMKKGLPLDIKIACMEAGLQTTMQDLPRAKRALEQCNSIECQNPLILKCRLHVHIARSLFSAYIGVGGFEMKKHMQSAFELSMQISEDYSILRAANGRIWAEFEEVKHKLTEGKLDEIMSQVQRNMELWETVPEWMRVGNTCTLLAKAFFDMEMAQFYRNKNKSVFQASVSSAKFHLQQVDQLHLDSILKGFCNHTLARVSAMQGDTPKATEHAKLACSQYLENFMFQRALQVACQVQNSDLERHVREAIKHRGF